MIKFYTKREDKPKWFAERFKEQLQGSVLDIGCDEKQLKKYVGGRYVGVDMSENADYRLNLDNISRLPFEDKEFDTVYCTDVLEHLENFHLIFDEIIRTSAKDVIISLPVASSSFYRYAFKMKQNNPSEKGLYSKYYGLPIDKPSDRHRWFLSYDDILRFINSRKGYSVASIETDIDHKKGVVWGMLRVMKNINPNLFVNTIIIHLKRDNDEQH